MMAGMETIITLDPTWSWPTADLMLKAVQDGVAAGLAALPASAGAVLGATLFGKTTEVRESVAVRPDECTHGWERPLARKGQITTVQTRVVGPVPWLRVTTCTPAGEEREFEVCVDPATLLADTPAEAEEYAEALVVATLGTPPGRSIRDLVAGALRAGAAELGGVLGFEEALERARVEPPGPAPTLEQLEARARMIYGDYAAAHERTGTPDAHEIAEQLHLLRRDFRLVDGRLADAIVRTVPAEQIRRLERLLERAYELEVAEAALAAPELVE